MAVDLNSLGMAVRLRSPSIGEGTQLSLPLFQLLLGRPQLPLSYTPPSPPYMNTNTPSVGNSHGAVPVGWELPSVRLETTVGDCQAIDLAAAKATALLIPTGVTSLTYYGLDELGNPFPLYTAGGAAVTQTVAADRWYPLPAEVLPFSQIKIVANVYGLAKLAAKT